MVYGVGVPEEFLSSCLCEKLGVPRSEFLCRRKIQRYPTMLFFSPLVCGAVLLVAPCLAAPANLGLKFNKRAGGLPTLTLPYGTWRASSYNPNGDVCR